MITGRLWKLLEESSMRRIEEAALHLVGKSGCFIEHEGLLGMLEGAGCRIDRSGLRCYFPEKLVRDAIGHVGGASNCEVSIPTGWDRNYPQVCAGSFPHLLEWPSGKRRLATRQDVIDIARMAQTLDEITYVGRPLACSQVDQRVEPLWTVLTTAQITNKPPYAGEVFHAHSIEPLMRMGEIITGKPSDTTLVASCDYFTAPLKFNRHQAQCFLEKRRLGIRNDPGTMPISGISAPVTIAGTVVIALAELMAGWVMGYVVNPDLPAGGLVASGSLDMRTSNACFSSPEAMLQDVATSSIARELYGIGVGACTGYVDCKRPGLEAAFHKMFSVIGAPFGTARHVVSLGLLSAGQDYSPVQHLLDAEMSEALERFWGSFDVDEETIAVDLIEEMIAADTPGFLETEHTLSLFKREQWYPKWLNRKAWQGREVEKEAERAMLERIDRYCKDAVARYEPPDIDPAKVSELKRVFLSAERDILGENVSCV